MASRPLPAGPVIELRGAQCRGHHVLRYAVGVDLADPFAAADDFAVPLSVTYGAGCGDRPAHHTGPEVTGAVVSAIRRDDAGRLEFRVFNPTDAPGVVRIASGDGLGRRPRSIDPHPLPPLVPDRPPPDPHDPQRFLSVEFSNGGRRRTIS